MGKRRWATFIPFISSLLKSQMWILHLADKFSYCPSLPNLNLGDFQSKCLDFYKLSTDIAVFPVLILGKQNKTKQSCPFDFAMQKLWFWKF